VPPTSDRCRMTGKVAHRHYRAAADALRKHRAAAKFGHGKRDTMCVYLCRHCGKWHTGNRVEGED
jgi:rubrerythrin